MKNLIIVFSDFANERKNNSFPDIYMYEILFALTRKLAVEVHPTIFDTFCMLNEPVCGAQCYR
jgi:hypothetical protein